jgi:RHS repeat-associated protein
MKHSRFLLVFLLAAGAACSSGNGARSPVGDAGDRGPPTCIAGSPGCDTLDPTVTTNLADASKFLYTGPDPIQKGVTAGAIDLVHVSVLRGQVFARSTKEPSGLAPLPGVTVVVQGHPELGYTESETDGSFSMAINGGGVVTVAYSKTGYIGAQRSVTSRWLDYAIVNDLLMTQHEPGATVTLSASSTDFQVVRGQKHGAAPLMTPAEDDDGARTATLLIPPKTTASIEKLNDAPVTIHATELTTGSLGLKAMPAELAPTTAYTYAADFNIDEADGASVSFNQPIVFYLENFIGLPVGDGKSATPMPMGFYDPGRSVWSPVESGQVLRVLSNDGSTVSLELDGKGTAAADGDFTPPLYAGERAQIAKLYPKGTELWRIGIPHFSAYDGNLGFGPPDDAAAPSAGSPDGDSPNDDSCQASGSIIECENQILAEQFPVSGTSYVLRYQSERTIGNLSTLRVRIPLTGKTPLTPDVEGIHAFVHVAGRSFTYTSTSLAPDQAWTWTWDHKDAFGRVVSGSAVAHIGVGYTYDATSCPYLGTKKFGFWGNGTPISANRTLKQVTLWQYFDYPIDHVDAKTTFGLGGFSISAQNLYDPSGQMFWGGNGTRRSINGEAFDVIDTYAGGNDARTNPGDGGKATKAELRPAHIALASDGTLYVADITNSLVRKVKTDGTITSIAGNGQSEDGTSGDHGNGKKATEVAISPYGVAVGPDGTVYVTTQSTNRVRKIDPTTGIIQTVAGNGSSKAEYCVQGDTCHDGQVATEIPLGNLYGVAMGPDGAVYFSEDATGSGRVRRLDLDGTLSTVTANLGNPDGISFAPDGSFYVADSYGVPTKFGPAVLRVTPAGKQSIVAGGGSATGGGDGGPALQAGVWPSDVVVAPNGGYYIADTENHEIRYVDSSGVIRTIAGNGDCGSSSDIGDGGPAGSAKICFPGGLALTSSGTLYIADSWHNRVRAITPPLPGFSLGSSLLTDPSGAVVYEFDAEGRHLSTHDASNGQTLLSLSYDKSGLLTSFIDFNKRTTVIDRSAGKIVIHAPFGQETTLVLDKDGYASSLTDGAGSTTNFSYVESSGVENGLLATLTDPEGHVHDFKFSSEGLLLEDDNPAGGRWTLARTPTTSGWQVGLTSRLGRKTRYDDSVFDHGGTRRVTTNPSGMVSTYAKKPNGQEITTIAGADGTRLGSWTLDLGPDPRWQMEAPSMTSATTATGGVTMTAHHTRSVKKTGSSLFDLGSQTDALVVNPKSADALEVTTVYTHGSSSNTFDLTTGAGRTMTVELDSNNRVTSVSAPDVGTQSFTYDTSPCPGSAGCGGRVTGLTWTSSNPKEGTRTLTPKYGYSPDDGFLSALVDSLERTNSFSRDGVGRVTGAGLPVLSGTKATENQIQLSYDKNGNVARVAIPSAAASPPVHAFPSYSPIDLLQTYEPPQATPALTTRETLFAYDSDGELTSRSAPEASGYAKVSVLWDSAGRLSEVSDPKGATTTFAYAKSGLLKSIATSDGTALGFGYAGLLPTTATWTGSVSGTLTWTYDDFFRVASRTVGTTTVAYTRDSDGLFTGTTSPAAFTVGYDVGGKNGLLVGSSLGGVADTWTYDGFGEPASYGATFGATTLYAMSAVSRDAAGHITAMTENVAGTTHTWAFAYDEHDDLVGATRDGTKHTYAFDPNGNRTESDGAAQGPYDAQDRLVSSGYTYSNNGDLLAKTGGLGAGTYAYDLSGNLRGVELASGDTVSYVVDGQNRRVGKKLVLGGTPIAQGFLYDDQLRIAAELDASNAVVSVFVYGARRNVPDYMMRGGETYRIVSDWRGSVRSVVDASTGAAIETLDYDAWGNVTSLVDSTCSGAGCFSFQPFGFAGGIYDKDTGLVRFGTRDYDPSVGRWTQKDATGFGGGTNFYAYAFNDPINWVDIDGHFPSVCINPFSGAVYAAYNVANQAFTAANNSFCGGDTSIDWGDVAEAGILGSIEFGACFTEGTPVTTCDGSRQPIETLREGDLVLSRNEDTGQVECKPVVRTFEHVADDVARLEASDADGREQTFEVTLGHRFWVDGKGWTPVRELGDGDGLWSPDARRVVVDGWAREAGSARVFNLEVEGDHSYFVGDERVWVHNTCVLGKYPAYVEMANSIGADYLNVPTDIWNAMSPAEQWATNQAFLDTQIAKGEPIFLASPTSAANAGSFFAQELDYMAGKGYLPNALGNELVKK